MRVTMSGRHMEITDALKDHVQSGLQKLKAHFDRIIDANVILAVEKHRHIAEITIHANGIRIHGKESTDDMYKSVDAVVEKLDKQITKYKDRIKKYQPRKAREEREYLKNIIAIEEPTAPVEETKPHRVIHREKLTLKPMTVEEASMQLELADEPFLVFMNAETQQVNVIYPQGDGTFVLIEPPF